MGAGERSVKCILKDTVKIVEKIREIKKLHLERAGKALGYS